MTEQPGGASLSCGAMGRCRGQCASGAPHRPHGAAGPRARAGEARARGRGASFSSRRGHKPGAPAALAAHRRAAARAPAAAAPGRAAAARVADLSPLPGLRRFTSGVPQVPVELRKRAAAVPRGALGRLPRRERGQAAVLHLHALRGHGPAARGGGAHGRAHAAHLGREPIIQARFLRGPQRPLLPAGRGRRGALPGVPLRAEQRPRRRQDGKSRHQALGALGGRQASSRTRARGATARTRTSTWLRPAPRPEAPPRRAPRPVTEPEGTWTPWSSARTAPSCSSSGTAPRTTATCTWWTCATGDAAAHPARGQGQRERRRFHAGREERVSGHGPLLGLRGAVPPPRPARRRCRHAAAPSSLTAACPGTCRTSPSARTAASSRCT